MPDETLSVTFTYSTTTGVFTGHFANGVSFTFIAAPDSPLPTKLRNALQGLMAKAHTAFKTQAKPTAAEDDEAWAALTAKIAEFEARHGVTRSTRKAVKRKAPKLRNLTLEDLGL